MAPVHRSLNIGRSFTIVQATTHRLRSIFSILLPITCGVLMRQGVNTVTNFDSSFEICSLDILPLDSFSSGRTASPSLRNMVSSVPNRLGEHPGEATLLHGKAVKARSTTSKIHTSGLWIDKLANQELLSQEESRTATPTARAGRRQTRFTYMIKL